MSVIDPAAPTQKAIIHTATGVVRKVTTDENPTIADDESIVALSAPLDLSQGFIKIDIDGKVVPADPADIDAAGVDDILEAAKQTAKMDALKSALTAVINDKTVPNTLKVFAETFLAVL